MLFFIRNPGRKTNPHVLPETIRAAPGVDPDDEKLHQDHRSGIQYRPDGCRIYRTVLRAGHQPGLHFVHNNYEVAGRVSAFKRFIRERWDGVVFVSVDSNARPKMAVGEKLMVSAVVRLGEIAPEHVAVEVLYGEAGDSGLSNITVVGISCEGKRNPVPTALPAIFRSPREPLGTPGE